MKTLTDIETDIIDTMVTNEALHLLHTIQMKNPHCVRAIARATIKAHALYLRVTYGPEETAHLLYQLADEAAERVPPSVMTTRVQKGK